MIYRGTTPTHIFSFPFGPEEVSEIYVTYWQKGFVVMEKDFDDVKFDGGAIKISLTQEDTLAFRGCNPRWKTFDSTIFIQIRALLKNGEAWASEIIKERAGDILKDGLI